MTDLHQVAQAFRETGTPVRGTVALIGPYSHGPKGGAFPRDILQITYRGEPWAQTVGGAS